MKNQLSLLSDLERLDLRSNRLVGPIPTELGLLTNLELLDLSTNDLTGPIPSELGQLSSLGKSIASLLCSFSLLGLNNNLSDVFFLLFLQILMFADAFGSFAVSNPWGTSQTFNL